VKFADFAIDALVVDGLCSNGPTVWHITCPDNSHNIAPFKIEIDKEKKSCPIGLNGGAFLSYEALFSSRIKAG
jgi:hypothetical protein